MLQATFPVKEIPNSITKTMARNVIEKVLTGRAQRFVSSFELDHIFFHGVTPIAAKP